MSAQRRPQTPARAKHGGRLRQAAVAERDAALLSSREGTRVAGQDAAAGLCVEQSFGRLYSAPDDDPFRDNIGSDAGGCDSCDGVDDGPLLLDA
jgi:hypothetical protein